MSDELQYPVPDDLCLLPEVRAFHRANKQLEQHYERYLASMQLDSYEFDILAVLGDTDGKTFAQVSEELLVSGPSVTRRIAKMVEKGYAEWVTAEQNARKRFVKLTPAGQARYEEVFLPSVQGVRARFERLTPKERAQLVRLLDKVAGAFSDDS